MEGLIRANLHYLQEAILLLDRLDGECFAEPSACFYHSSVGGHLRHCIEHYQSFLDGLGRGLIDYDARKRDAVVETSAVAARESLGRIAEGMEHLLGRELPERVQVKMDCGCDEIPWQPSTVGRELQFLVSHTVHHFAMIGGICAAQGWEVEECFGVAPSTIRHRVEVEAG